MRRLGLLQIKDFQQGSHPSEPFFAARVKVAPAPSFEFPPRWLVSLPLPPREDLIANNGPSHLAPSLVSKTAE